MRSKGESDESGQRPIPAAPDSAWGPETLFGWPFAAATLFAQTSMKLLEDIMSSSGRRSASGGSPLPWNTENTILLELASLRLRDFSTGTSGPATLVCAPYALHGAAIADFAPDHSVVQALRAGGLSRIHVVDWRSAIPETRYFTIDTCLADLNIAVDRLGPPVDLIGLCQGGWLALVYAARFPGKVRRLVLVGAPIDTAVVESQLSRFVMSVPLNMFEELVRQGHGIVRGDLTLAVWGVPTSANEPEAVLQFSPDIDPARRYELSDRFRRWYAETLDLPGAFYLQVVKWLFKESRIAEGKFVALGERIDLTALRVPIFFLAAGQDEVVPAAQLLAAARLVGTPAAQQETITESCGHLSLFLGAAVLRGPWGRIANWLVRDLNEPPVDTTIRE